MDGSYLLAALVGGLLAIAASVGATLTAANVERRRGQLDAQWRASQEVLAALQDLVRQLIDLAYSPDTGNEAARAQGILVPYHLAVTRWNAAVYAALLVESDAAARMLPKIDREIDRLFDLAWVQLWNRPGFRDERRNLGKLAATYLDQSRSDAGRTRLGLESIWTWEAADY